MIQPIAQLRQPYIVTLTSQVIPHPATYLNQMFSIQLTSGDADQHTKAEPWKEELRAR